MEGRARCHPKPNGPFPDPESYERESDGLKSLLGALMGIGTSVPPVPFIVLTENFSPMPRIAPPPFGRLIEGSGFLNPPALGDSVWGAPGGAALPCDCMPGGRFDDSILLSVRVCRSSSMLVDFEIAWWAGFAVYA
jgi:hypothetical protein